MIIVSESAPKPTISSCDHEGKPISQDMRTALHEAILKTRIYPGTKNEQTIEHVLEDLNAGSNLETIKAASSYKIDKDIDKDELGSSIKACIELYLPNSQKPNSQNDCDAQRSGCGLIARDLFLSGGRKNNFVKQLDENLCAAVDALRKKYPAFAKEQPDLSIA